MAMIFVPDVKVGDKFGRLTFLGLADRDAKNRQWNWHVRCDCGVEKVVIGANVRHGKSTSCGCYQREWASKTKGTHRMSGTKAHRTWKGIKQRCLNSKSKFYSNYGGRGIGIDPNWASDFTAFYKYVGEPPTPNHTLGRIDNDKGYEPGNVRWATASEQIRNRRISVWVNYQNQERFLKELCTTENLNYWIAYDMIVRRKIKVDVAIELLRSSKEAPITQGLEEPPKIKSQ